VDLILPLYQNLLYVKGDKEITVALDLTTNYITPTKWRQYVQFQAEYKERIGLLRREQRAIPKDTGADKNMPPILQSYEGKHGSAQPVKNLKKNLSCAFSEEQVQKYEELNQGFLNATKLAAPAAAAKIIPLLLFDIAYLKSFDVEWERTAPALEAEVARDDDDDDEVDTSSWHPTEPETVPFRDLKYSKTGKMATAALYGAAILGVSPNPTPEVKNWVVQVLDRYEQLQETVPPNALMTEILTRALTEDENEIFAECIRKMGRNRYGANAGDADADVAAATSTADTAAAAAPPPAAATATATATACRGGRAAGAAAAADAAGGGTAATAASDPHATDDDDVPLSRSGGRQKQRARVRSQPPRAVPTSDARRTSVQTKRFRPEDTRDSPTAPRIVVKKRKGNTPTKETDMPVVEAHAIPVSEYSHRVMLGQLDINKRFPKNYMAKRPIKKSPIAKATLSSIWHAVRNPHNET